MSTDLDLRLRRVEERLERLLVSGWRNAGAEATDLAEEAEALAELGFGELAERLRGVAAAEGGSEALRAVTLAATACRLLRARLPAEAPTGEWLPIGKATRRRGASTERLLPIGRMALEDGEAWACVRLRGTMADDWLLLDPPTLPELASEPARVGLAARLMGRGRAAAASDNGSSVWLSRPIEGVLRWRARYPLGASGDVQHCGLSGAAWAGADQAEVPLATLRKALAGSPKEDRLLLGGWLRLKQLDPAEVESYVWPDPAVASAFRAAGGPVWALAWVQGGPIAPLVLIEPGGVLRKPRLVHLVPGLPGEALVG
jgi:hypothetical protein